MRNHKRKFKAACGWGKFWDLCQVSLSPLSGRCVYPAHKDIKFRSSQFQRTVNSCPGLSALRLASVLSLVSAPHFLPNDLSNLSTLGNVASTHLGVWFVVFPGAPKCFSYLMRTVILGVHASVSLYHHGKQNPERVRTLPKSHS